MAITPEVDGRDAIEISEIQDNAGDSIAKRVAHWFASAVSGNEENNIDLPEKQDLIDLAQMSEKNEISSTSAKELFHDLLKGATDPRKLAEVWLACGKWSFPGADSSCPGGRVCAGASG